ncbi:MAG: phenylacetate--CoA ligase family protein, partial [Phycisphaerae bacterium]
MLPFIARHLICPAHERLLGRRTFRYLRELEEWQWASPDDLRTLQRAKLQRLLQHARANTHFYRRRFREAGVNPDSADSFDALSGLPLLNKAEIRASIDEMIWHDV